MLPPQPPPALQPPSRFHQIRSLILRWLITTLSLFAAVYLIDGIEFSGPGWELGLVAAVFGLINAGLRPLLALLTCPLIILTLGLFTLVINALLLLLTAQIAASLGVAFTVGSFWAAFLGGLVISICSTVLGMLAGESNVQVIVRNDRTV